MSVNVVCFVWLLCADCHVFVGGEILVCCFGEALHIMLYYVYEKCHINKDRLIDLLINTCKVLTVECKEAPLS